MKKVLILLSILLFLLLAACGNQGAPAPAAETAGHAEETPAPTETAGPEEEPPAPVAVDNSWLEDLPWEENWTCLILGWKELEPEAGKEALRELLYAYDWTLIDPEAKEPDFFPEGRGTAIYLDEVFAGRDTAPIRFWFEKNGDLYWNGTLRRPLGEGAGERLLADWKALAETGISVGSPPDLTLRCGEAETNALIHGTYSWSYDTRIGEHYGAESDSFAMFYDYDWLGTEAPILRAQGDVVLDFASREPDSLGLTVFTPLGQAPAELRDGRFTPYAGVNTYALSAHWDKAEQGGYGSCIYILLVEGDGPRELPQPEFQVSGEILEADAYGCTFALENRESRALYILENQSTWTKLGINPYSLFRRTESGGLAWIRPQRLIEIDGWIAGNDSPLGLDWSYAYGALEPGEYVLLLSGSLLSKNDGRPQADFYLPLPFTLGEDCMPEPPGPDALSPAPEGIISAVTQLSPHRWLQTLSQTGEGTVRADRDYSLFRLEESGALAYIPPKYRLPYSLNHPWAVREAESSIAIDLAAYGDLECGTYVVRRRLYCPTAEEAESQSYVDRSWRTLPEERIRYLDAVIRLDTDRPEPDKGMEPMTVSPYAGEETVLPLTASYPYITPESCRFMLENKGELTVSFNIDSARLWFRDDAGEWLPLEIRRHKASGYALVPLSHGEGREYTFSFTSWYAPLTEGVYRLVLPLTVEGEEEGSWLAVEFRIRADGSGALN